MTTDVKADGVAGREYHVNVDFDTSSALKDVRYVQKLRLVKDLPEISVKLVRSFITLFRSTTTLRVCETGRSFAPETGNEIIRFGLIRPLKTIVTALRTRNGDLPHD